MPNLFGNHIVGFLMQWLIFFVNMVMELIFLNAALTYTEYPLQILKFEIRTEITEYDENGQGGACRKRFFANSLRMLADHYKCLKKVVIDYHPHRRILENAF